jgi:signal transduction histidine kinase
LSVDKPNSEPSPDVLLALNRSATVARLLSSAVHEVNNALQVISGTVEILEGRPDIDAALARSLERLRTQSARAAGALADVLVFSKAPLDESAAVNLRDTTAHSVGLRMFAVRRAGLTLRLEASESTPFIVRGSRGQLQQAILNLLVNAEQALAGSKGTIVVELTADGDWLVVRVTDDGRGITPEAEDAVFAPFVSTKAPADGAGLGLWAARRIAEAHGGTLTFEARSPGASFVMRLPRASASSTTTTTKG